jgi:peptidoglycan/LPS O-acetylase OafA/YrhL
LIKGFLTDRISGFADAERAETPGNAIGGKTDDSRRRFDFLDSYRGVAALGVLLYHLGLSNPGSNIAPHGYLAVDLFFGLSGIVIAHAYEERLRAGLPCRAFLRARVRRLYPIYFAGVILGLISFLLNNNLTDFGLPALSLALISALLITPCFGFGTLFPLNGPSWSLCLELVVNSAFALVARHLTTLRLAIWITLSGVALAFFAWREGGLVGGDTASNFLTGVSRAFFGFAIGLLIYRLHKAKKLPGAGRMGGPAIPISIMALMFALPTMGSANALTDFIFVALVCPLLLSAGVQAGSQGASWVGRGLGAISYALYAVHEPVFGIARRLIALPLGEHTLPLGVSAAIVAAIVVTQADALIRRAAARGSVEEPRASGRLAWTSTPDG